MTQQEFWRTRPLSALISNLGALPYTGREIVLNRETKPASFASAPEPELCPESGDSPGIPARQRMTSQKSGVLFNDFTTQERLTGSSPVVKSPNTCLELESRNAYMTLPKFVRNCRDLSNAI